MRLQLTFAAGGYDFVRPLADGTVKPDGIDLVMLSRMGSGERHHRMGHCHEFDLCDSTQPPILRRMTATTRGSRCLCS